MKTQIGVLVVLVGLFLPYSIAFCQAEEKTQGLYIEGQMGLNGRPDAKSSGTAVFEFNPGISLSGALGYQVSDFFRVEGEIGYRTNSAEVAGSAADWSFSALSLMGNVYLDIPTGSKIRPFLGAGAGVAAAHSYREIEIAYVTYSDNDSDSVFAYQFMGGLGYQIKPRATLSLKYRYFATEDPKFNIFGAAFETEIESHEILFGARILF